MSEPGFVDIPEAVEAIRRGGMVILVDDEDRENEGDLVIAAECVDEKAVAFMATKACGLICLAMDGDMLERIGLPMMTNRNRSRLGTAFTVSIEAAEGVTTGISAKDRATTILAAVADDASPRTVVSPGHIFPLRAQDGGVLVRAGQTEGSVDLCRLAGRKSAAVICEIMNPDGTMARRSDLQVFAKEFDIPICTVADLIAYRERRESLIELVAEAEVDTVAGPCRAYTYRSTVHDAHHLVMAYGDRLRPGSEVSEPVLVRVHKERLLSDAFGCGEQPGALPLRQSLSMISEAGEGLVLYIRDIAGSHLTSQLQARGGTLHVNRWYSGSGMDPRDYGIGAQIIADLGVRHMKLITANDQPITALSGFGLEVVERINPLVDGNE